MTEWIDYQVARAVSGAVLHSLWQGALVVAVLWAGVRSGLLRTIEQKFHAHIAGAIVLLGTTIFTFNNLLAEAPAITQEVVIPILQWQSSGVTDVSGGSALGFDWHRMITMAWCVGVLIFLSRFFTGWLGARRLTVESQSAGMHWQRRVLQLGRKIGVTRRVRLLVSEATGVPFVFGIFRPVIVFPALYFTQLTPAQLESILVHELAHIRRHDYLFNCIQLLIESLLFFNPATWWLGRQIRTYREYACDDRVQTMMPNQRIYLEALYKVAEMTLVKPAPAVSLFSNNTELIMRVRRMLHTAPHAAQMRPFFTTALGLLVLVGLFIFNSGNILNAQEKAVDPPPKPEIENLIEKPLLEVRPLVDEMMIELEPLMNAMPEIAELAPVIEHSLALAEPLTELAPLSAELALDVAPVAELAISMAEIAPVMQEMILDQQPALVAMGELEVGPLVELAMETVPLIIEQLDLSAFPAIGEMMHGLDTVPESKKLKELQKLIEIKSAEMEELSDEFESEMESNIGAEIEQLEALAQQLEDLQEQQMEQLEEQIENSEWEQQMEQLSDDLEARMESYEEQIESSIDEDLMEQLEEQLEEKARAYEGMDTIPPEMRQQMREEMRKIQAQMHEHMTEMREKHAEMRNDPEIQRLRQEMRDMHKQMAPLHEAHREMMNSPEMKELREKLREQQALMREKMHGFNSELREQMRAKSAELRELQKQMAEEMRRLHHEKGNR